MSFQVTISPSGRQFICDDDETILSGALRNGLILPYGCKNGACGSCKGKIIAGNVKHGPHQVKALNDEEESQGAALFCCAKPLGDVTIEAREVLMDEDYPIKKMPCRIAKMERVSNDVMIMTLQLPTNETFNYRPGQYIEFILKDGKRRSYSLADASQKNQTLSLHIRHMPGGLFTDQVFNVLKERDILRFEGPQGSFYLREENQRPIILLASGTGFAPIKAIIEHLIASASHRTIYLYWGGRSPSDLYMNAVCHQWSEQLPNFHYTPVISNASPNDQWDGRIGFVHLAVIVDHPNLSQFQVYACGAPIVIESAKRDFVEKCGLPKDEFFADSFTSEADLLTNQTQN